MIDFLASFFRAAPERAHPSLDTALRGPRLMLRMVKIEDWKAWRALREASRDKLEPWEPAWPSNALTYGYFCVLVRRYWREWRNGKTYAFSIFLLDGGDPVLIGGITLGNVHYAAAQKATVGYWIGQPYVCQGYMHEALTLVSTFAFTELKLQRLEASCLPNNEPSKAVLRRCGFEEEGFAREYLQINGKREDHLLWGKNKLANKA
ncbi:MAG: GNAT family protein [Bdellovibrionales bacterium]